MSLTKPTRIGFPRGLLYHKYAPMWTYFFRALGCQTISSPETNRQILDQGIHYSIDENCLAVKMFLGHVQYLIGKVDYIFIPRFVSLYPDEECCVKLFALADMVRNTFDDVQILEYTVDISNRQPEWIGLIKLGLRLNHNFLKVLRAYRRSIEVLHQYKHARLDKQQTVLRTQDKSKTYVLLVAHSYIIHDALLGKMVTGLLRELGVEIIYADIAEEKAARERSPELSIDLHWSYNKELLGAIQQYRASVDGIIFLMTYPCGPDSLVTNLCQHKITDVPLCVLVMDELQGDAGIRTRLESFIDILQFKKEKRA